MADTGWLNFTNFANIDRGENGFGNPDRAIASDGSYATCVLNALAYSDWLHCYEIDWDGSPLDSG